MSFFNPLWRAAMFLMSASLPFALQAQTGVLPPLPTDANQYVKDTIKYQTEADAADHTHWRYRIHREDEKGAQDRDVIDTKDGQLARTLLINGQPLTPEQRAADSSELSGELDNRKGEGAQNTQNGQGGQGAKTGKSGPGRDAA